MGFYTTTSVTEKPHPETPSCAQKTASGNFFTYPIKTQHKNRHNSLITNQEKPLSTHETASGVFYYKFRHYSAELGRWLARDPIGENGGVNLYGFVENDGINKLDILGLKKCCVKESAKFSVVAGDPGLNNRGEVNARITGERQWARFKLSASFSSEGECCCSCCQVRQWIKWEDPNYVEGEPFRLDYIFPPHAGFPDETRPNRFYEDRSRDGLRVGSRDKNNRIPWERYYDIGAPGKNGEPVEIDNLASGCNFYGADKPSMHKDNMKKYTKWVFHLAIVDVCNNDRKVEDGDTLTVIWQQ